MRVKELQILNISKHKLRTRIDPLEYFRIDILYDFISLDWIDFARYI